MTGAAHAVAAEIRRRQPDVAGVKLHKLMYYAQGHHLAATGEALFPDTISAWDMGPVVGTLWHAEKHGLEDSLVAGAKTLGEAELNTIGYVLHRYGGMTGSDLKRLSHGETPWRDADEHRAPGGRATIPIESIRSYFEELQREDDDVEVGLTGEVVSELVGGAEDRRARPARVDSLDEIQRRLRALRE